MKPMGLCKILQNIEEKYSCESKCLKVLVGSNPYLVQNISKEITANRSEMVMVRKEPTVEFEKFYSKALRRGVRRLIKNTVIVADDNQFNLLVISEMMASEGIKGMMASSGREALQLFFDNKEIVRLVILDIEMDDLDGYEVAEMIRAYARDNKMKCPEIYGLTGHCDQDSEVRGLKAGMKKIMRKPITSEELTTLIDKYLV